MIIESKGSASAVDERARMETVQGILFDVQRYSMHDGPGIRTNLFFKGCPLRCGWCANPESQNLQPEYALSAQNCITCGQFAASCPDGWGQKNGQGNSQPPIEIDYGVRVDICPTGAIHVFGELRTAGDVMREVRRDAPFYGERGGLTLTGGEATMQPDMAEALLRLAKLEGIHTAIETCGHTHWPIFERLLPHLDLILYDLKHVDRAKHKADTGLDNDLILGNLRHLVELGAPLTLRIPLIPGFNADRASMEAMAQFIGQLGGDGRVDVLPYHTLGKSKYTSLGRDYLWDGHNRLTQPEIETCVAVLEAHNLHVCIGG